MEAIQHLLNYINYIKVVLYHFVWADQRLVQGNISYIAWESGSFDPHFRRNFQLYIVKHLPFTCGMEFCTLTIIENTIIFIVADIYEQEPTSGEFLSLRIPYFSTACNF